LLGVHKTFISIHTGFAVPVIVSNNLVKYIKLNQVH